MVERGNVEMCFQTLDLGPFVIYVSVLLNMGSTHGA